MMVVAGLAAWLLVLGVFSTSTLAKLRNWSSVGTTIAAFGFAGRGARRILGAQLVVAEAGTVLMLIARPSLGLTFAMVLLVIFTSVGVVAIRRGVSVPCNCVGRGGTFGMVQLDRNAVLMAATATALVSSPSTVSEVDLAAVPLASTAAVVVLLLLLYAEDLGQAFDLRGTSSPSAGRRQSS